MNLYQRLSFHDHSRVDPTKTVTLRTRYERDLVRRFRAVAAAIRKAVGDDDLLAVNDVRPPARFDFKRDPEKVSDFMDWLRRMTADGILEVREGTPQRSAASRSWQNVYLRSAYQKGLAQAAGQMERAGAVVEATFVDAGFYRPIHADRVGLIYTRAFSDLKGITDAMDQKISRVLAQGIAEGVGPRVIAKRITDQVEGIGIVRARMLARTEVIRAHADATLNSFKEAGLEGVKVLVEFATAGDSKVCPRCAELDGKVFKIAEAEGLIPVHPNCRCAFVPAVDDMRGVTLR